MWRLAEVYQTRPAEKVWKRKLGGRKEEAWVRSHKSRTSKKNRTTWKDEGNFLVKNPGTGFEKQGAFAVHHAEADACQDQ